MQGDLPNTRSTPCHQLARLLAATLCLASGNVLSAETQTPASTTDPSPTIDALTPLDSSRDALSQQITTFANWLDNFFGDDRVYEESQKSHLKINLLHIRNEGNEPHFDANVQGKLSLPNTQNRLKILFESDAEDENLQSTTVAQAVESQQQSIGIRYVRKTVPEWRIHADLGIRFHSGLDAFARFRVRRLFTTGLWNFLPSEILFWYKSTGFGETTALDINRRFAEHFLFRSATQATWLDESQQFEMSQNFYLIHDINPHRAIIYQTGINGVSEPHVHTTSYLASVRLRQQLHHDWLFFEVNPIIDYPEEEDFQAHYSLTFKLEVIFGGT